MAYNRVSHYSWQREWKVVKKCSLEGCDNPLPSGRTKYCSHECYLKASRLLSVLRSRNREYAYKSQRYKRRCLRCDRAFLSSGKYNRLCSKCNDVNSKVRGLLRFNKNSEMDDVLVKDEYGRCVSLRGE